MQNFSIQAAAAAVVPSHVADDDRAYWSEVVVVGEEGKGKESLWERSGEEAAVTAFGCATLTTAAVSMALCSVPSVHVFQGLCWSVIAALKQSLLARCLYGRATSCPQCLLFCFLFHCYTVLSPIR